MSSGDAERTENKNLTPTPASVGSTPNLSGTHTLPDVSKSIYGEVQKHVVMVYLAECLCPSGSHPPPFVSLVQTDGYPDIKMNVKFVQDTSKYWYKPDITREQGER